MRHSIALLTIAAAALFLMFASSTPVAFAQAQPQSLLTRHVRDVTLNGQAPSVGRLPATPVHADRHCSAGARSGRVG